jgi:CubicO group peptidase (beta-lactamase class C family)
MAASLHAEVDSEIAVALESVLRHAEAEGFSGVLLVRRGQTNVFLGAYGPGSCDRAQKLSTDYIFDIGLITKVFTAAAILRAQQDGLLALNQPLHAFFPNVPTDKQDITIIQLLQHQSGFPESLGEDETIIKRNFFLRDALARPLAHKPGERTSYSNTGYSMAAAILENASGQRYEEFLRQRVVAPSGARVGYSWAGAASDKFACGFREKLPWGSTRDYFSRAIIRLILSELLCTNRVTRTCTLRHVSGSDKPTSEHGGCHRHAPLLDRGTTIGRVRIFSSTRSLAPTAHAFSILALTILSPRFAIGPQETQHPLIE